VVGIDYINNLLQAHTASYYRGRCSCLIETLGNNGTGEEPRKEAPPPFGLEGMGVWATGVRGEVCKGV